MQDQQVDLYYETNQTVVAAYLVCMGHTLVDVIWDEGMASFTFEASESVNKDVLVFVSGKALVEPTVFNTSFGRVKRAMFDHPDCPANRGRRG